MLPLLALLGCNGCSEPPPPPATPPPAVRQADPRGRWTVIRPAERDPERWGHARCNEGSPTSVAVHRGTSKEWVIRMAGGWYCDEKTMPCARRARRYTVPLQHQGRAVPDGETYPGPHTGLFLRDPEINRELHDANQALLHYCSSDLWLGESTEKQPHSGSAEGWYFSGRHNLRAGVEALELMGLDRSDPETRVLLVGQSSGGIGLAQNLALVTELFPTQVEQGTLKVVVDGGWLPVLPMRDTFELNRWGSLLPDCVAEQDDPRACVFGPTWIAYWERAGIDVMVAQSGQDFTQVKQLEIESGLAREAFRDQVRDSLSSPNWVISGGFSYHVLAFDARLSATPFGHLFYEQIERMWRDEEPRRVLHRYSSAP